MDRLAAMLSAQLDVQKLIQPSAKSILEMTEAERIEAIRYNYIALIQEMSEAMDEVGWKSWATSRHINEDLMFGELRDVWQFLANLMFLATMQKPDELADRLERELYTKHAVNIQRAKDNYDSISSKCPNCKRDLADVSLFEIQKPDGTVEYVKCVCTAYIPIDVARPYLRD